MSELNICNSIRSILPKMYLWRLKIELQIYQKKKKDFLCTFEIYSWIPLSKQKVRLHYLFFNFFFSVYRLCVASTSNCINLFATTWAGTALSPPHTLLSAQTELTGHCGCCWVICAWGWGWPLSGEGWSPRWHEAGSGRNESCARPCGAHGP